MSQKLARPRRTWLANCVSVTAGISVLAGCTNSSDSTPSENETETDAELPADSWPMYGVDPQNTGYHPTATGPKGDEVTYRTVFEAEGVVSNSPAIVDDMLYVAADNHLHAVDLTTEKLEWQKEVTASPGAHPAVADDRVFAGTKDGIVAAALEDGEILWREDIGISSISPVLSSDSIIGTQNLFLHRFSIEDGGEITLHDMRDHQGGRPYTDVPATNDGSVYFASGDTLYAVDMENSKIQWMFESPTGETVGESNPAVVNSTVFIGDEDHQLYAIKDGREEWAVEIDASVECSPSVANGVVYFGGTGTGTQKLFAVDIESREHIWGPTELPYRVQTKPLITNDTVYISSYHDLFALDTDDGTVRWHLKQIGENDGEPIRAPPALSNGTLYVPTAEGNVYAVEEY